jgi:glycosyltransferase involved in cell wall biosynthesis/tetratricopeptide (TPR) repeat protein
MTIASSSVPIALTARPLEGRRLRVGFIGQQFGPYTETYTTLPLFEHLDPERFETILFAAQLSDATVEKHCREHASAFHLLPETFDAQLQAVRVTKLDVLVFGADVTDASKSISRLAQHRLAPLQVVSNSADASTRLPEMDLFIFPAGAESPELEKQFTERLGLIPGAARTFQFEADRQEPTQTWTREMLSLPHDALVFVTAGDFSKITADMKRTWARLLQAVTGSRLLVHPFGLNGASVDVVKQFCEEFDRVLAEHSVNGDRLIVSANAFPSRVDLNELLRVGDIYLDTFPASDANSVVNLLSCGTPVVTCAGDTLQSRAGASLLRALKLDEFIAGDEKQHHEIAVRLATDVAARNVLRGRIEDAMGCSPLFFDSLAASEAFGALIETAFNDLAKNGSARFRADRTPVSVVANSDFSAAESALASESASQLATCARAILAGDPANPRARHLYGAALLKLGRPERAAMYLLEAVQHLESNAPAWCDLARAFRATGQIREATQAIQVCLGIDGKHLEALLMLGDIAEQSGQLAELSDVAKLVIAIAPFDPRAHSLVAKVEANSAAPAPQINSANRFEFSPAPQAAPADPVDILANLSLDTLLPTDVVTSLDQAQRGHIVRESAPVAPSPIIPGVRPNPRALLFFLSAKESYRQPLFSTEEIFCSPDTESRTIGGKVITVKVSAGSFDVRDIIRTLPASQKPEIVIVKADATGRNLPRNLGALKCPKILIVGDTHHMRQPIQSLLRYAKEEPFDFIVFDHTRHHAHLFAEAGLKNVHWLPAVDYGFVPREIVKKPSRPLTFVGQAGRHHPYRCWVLDQVKAARLPLEMMRGSLAQTADIYADSQITLNVSLNGDLNLRVFESLAAGGFLLTDELTAHSGLPQLFEAGKHLDTWRTPGELVEKIRYYLAHPKEALRIRAAGQAELLRAHHPEVKLREFYDLVFSGKVNPVYDLSRDMRCARAMTTATTAPLAANDPIIVAYEKLQELHRGSKQVTVFCSSPKELSRLADLPRLSFAPLAELCAIEPAVNSDGPQIQSVLWWENNSATELATQLLTFGGHVIVPRISQPIIAVLDAYGYAAVEEGSCVYRLVRPVQALQRAWEAGQRDYVRSRLESALVASHDSNECLSVAHLADQLEDKSLKRAAIERAIGLDRGNQAALIFSAAEALDEDDSGSALVMLEEAARIQPLAAEVEELRANLYGQLGQHAALQPYYTMINRTPVPPAEHPRRILLVTNLFPPQELGGYGRKMWEFANGLVARGHHVRVLAGNLPEIAKQPTPDEVEMERSVSRKLQLLGTWTKGIPSRVSDPKEIEARRRTNIRLVKEALVSTKAEFLLAGNLDFLGADIINVAIEVGVPILQALGNTAPGYAPQEQPVSPRYWIGSCSHWNAATVAKNGYSVRTEVVYPGARVDRFFRFFMPERGRLRICFAGLVMPFKGVHILVEALGRLHQAGIDFTAEIAGETTNQQFLTNLHDFAQSIGMSQKIKYTGFLDRVELAALFARSNVLVFPSLVEEGFGISQVEALAAGLVVVSSGTGGAREIIRDGVDGMLYPSENVQALAEKLHALATNPELFAQLQAASQKRASEFAVEHSVRKIERCAEELIGGGLFPKLS